MAINKNEKIYSWNELLSSSDPSSLASLAENNASCCDTFSSRISSVMDGNSIDNWSDSIIDKLNETISGVKSNAEKVKVSCTFISQAAGMVNNLKVQCASYVQNFDNYLTELAKNVSEYLEKKPGEKYRRRNDEYDSWRARIKAYEISLQELESSTIQIYNAIKNYFSSIDLSKNIISGSFDISQTELSFDFEDYFNGQIAILNENKKVTSNKLMYDEEKGVWISEEEYNISKKFVDNAKLEGQGKITEEKESENSTSFLSKKTEEEGELTTGDGMKYLYLFNSIVNGKNSSSQTFLKNKNNEIVYGNKTDLNEDSLLGILNKKEFTIDKTDDSNVTIDKSISVSVGGDEENANKINIVLDNNSESSDTVVLGDEKINIPSGNRTGTSVYKNMLGDPEIQTVVYQGEDGKTKVHTEQGEIISDEVIDSTNTKTLTFKNKNGETSSMAVCVDNPIDFELAVLQLAEYNGGSYDHMAQVLQDLYTEYSDQFQIGDVTVTMQ